MSFTKVSNTSNQKYGSPKGVLLNSVNNSYAKASKCKVKHDIILSFVNLSFHEKEMLSHSVTNGCYT